MLGGTRKSFHFFLNKKEIWRRLIIMTGKSLFESILIGLDQAEEYIDGKNEKDVKVSRVTFYEVPKYDSDAVKGIRSELKLTQKAFANLLGVSVRTVESWEMGLNSPSGSSVRLMEIYKKHPDLKEELIKRDTVEV